MIHLLGNVLLILQVSEVSEVSEKPFRNPIVKKHPSRAIIFEKSLTSLTTSVTRVALFHHEKCRLWNISET
jgi:hypothetical protein